MLAFRGYKPWYLLPVSPLGRSETRAINSLAGSPLKSGVRTQKVPIPGAHMTPLVDAMCQCTVGRPHGQRNKFNAQGATVVA